MKSATAPTIPPTRATEPVIVSIVAPPIISPTITIARIIHSTILTVLFVNYTHSKK